MKKVWKWLDGNKSIICLTALYIVEAGAIPLTGGWSIAIKAVLMLASGGSIAHHIKKGHFSLKKN